MFQNLSDILKAYPGWLIVACAGTAVLAYSLGCFNGAVVVSRYILCDDVRDHGSGNAGLTNFHRTFGGPLTAAVILSDVVKMVIAILFSTWIFGVISAEGGDLVPFGKYWAGLFCLLGHMFPCTFQFRGGKGILSGGAMAIMMDWRVALVVWGGFLILAVLTRYVSLGSCWTGLSFPVVTWFVYRDPVLLALAVVIGGLILWKHRGNIRRLIAGTESKFSLHKKAAPEPEPPAPEPIPEERPVKQPPEEQPVEAQAVEAQPTEEQPVEAQPVEERPTGKQPAPPSGGKPAGGGNQNRGKKKKGKSKGGRK